jgi:hypothetical protein
MDSISGNLGYYNIVCWACEDGLDPRELFLEAA